MQRVFAALAVERVRRYLGLERESGERFIASRGPVEWLASFAPVGLAEIRAFVAGAASTVDLDEEAIVALASGLSAVLRLYAELGFQSFNLAIHGAAAGPEGFVVLRVVARAYFGALQRSDVMWSQRLQAETATDLKPEAVAERARELFALAA